MKLSLSWIADHLTVDWRTIDVPALAFSLTKTTAEIEGFYRCQLPLASLTMGRVRSTDQNGIRLELPELGKELTLPERTGAAVGQLFLIYSDGQTSRWATLADIASGKDGLMPAVSCADEDVAGGWKQQIVADDYIFELDNKSITHRPDLWSHRGFARELALLLKVPLKPLADFLATVPVTTVPGQEMAAVGKLDGLTVELQAPHFCKRLAVTQFDVQNQPSSLSMACALARVDSRPINMLVDATNYTMLDIGQPMHVFDAAAVHGQLAVSMAKKGQELVLLDGEKITLAATDGVIVDARGPLSLAGIMGGAQSGTQEATTRVVLEAGCFDAGYIRKTATRLKKRTEASARFEKVLDAQQPINALERFIKILEQHKVRYTAPGAIVALGNKPQATSIVLSHASLEKKLGVTVSVDFVRTTLTALDFGVVEQGGTYTITPPIARATKDVTIAEDVIEEIARWYGFDNIPFVLPLKPTQPHPIAHLMRLRAIKRYLAYGARMNEVYNYPFFDEAFLQRLGFEPEAALEVASPVSANMRRLATSLIPNLLKNIEQNMHKTTRLRFFEAGRIWTPPAEEKRLAAVIWDAHKSVDFFAIKEVVQTLFALVHLQVTWHAPTEVVPCWFDQASTAELRYGNKVIGFCGALAQQWRSVVNNGHTMLVELDGTLLEQEPVALRFKPLIKYQDVALDVSVLVPTAVTVGSLEQLIKAVDQRIQSVDLVDMFSKKEWHNQKSLTFRFVVADMHKTLEKHDIDDLLQRVTAALVAAGGVVR